MQTAVREMNVRTYVHFILTECGSCTLFLSLTHVNSTFIQTTYTRTLHLRFGVKNISWLASPIYLHLRALNVSDESGICACINHHWYYPSLSVGLFTCSPFSFVFTVLGWLSVVYPFLWLAIKWQYGGMSAVKNPIVKPVN